VPPLALDLLRSRAVVGAALLTVAVMIPTGAYDSIWPRYLADLGADDLLIGLSYTAFAIPYMLVATPAGRLADRIGGLAAAWRGILLVLLMMTTYMWLRSPVPAAFVGLLESTGQAVAYTAASAAVARSVPLERAGSAQGLARAMATLGATVVSFGSGPVYATGGQVPLFGGAIVLVLITMVAATRLLRSAERTAKNDRHVAVAPPQLQAA
jgi:MFS family permease